MVLATAAFESTEFRAREQSLNYTSAEQALRAWGPSREEIRQMPPADIENQYVRQPEALAQKVYGGKHGETLGNGPGNDDAWRYRARGLAYVTGRDNDQKVADSQHLQALMDNPDLLLIPEVNARSFIDFYFRQKTVPVLADAVRKKDLKGARVIVKENERDVSRPLNADELASVERSFGEVGEKTRTFSACIAPAREAQVKAASR
jgi:putative chitinase